MQRRTFLRRAGTGIAAGALATPAGAQAVPEIKWRLQSGFPKAADLAYGAATRLAEHAAAMTGGSFRIEVHARDEIVAGAKLLDSVQQGTIEACHADANAFFERDPVFAFFGAMPFGMSTRQQDAWMTHGGGLALLRAALKRHAVIGFPAGSTGIQMAGWFRREVKTPADLKGLKLRTGGFSAAVLARQGAVPQTLADREIYAALEAGRIDAVEWGGPYDDEKQGFYKVAKYYHYPIGTGEANPLVVMVNPAAWAALPKAYQAVFEAACVASGVDVRARYDASNPRALRSLLANGVQLRPFAPEIVKACFLAAEEVLAETAAGNDEFRKVHAGWRAFRDEQIRAFGLSEARSQSFMHTAVLTLGSAARK